MPSYTLSIVAILATLYGATGFVATNHHHGAFYRSAPPTALTMVSASSSGFDFHDEFHNNRESSSSPSSSSSDNSIDGGSLDNNLESSPSVTKFISGDELHQLRHKVLGMRLELEEYRRLGKTQMVHDIEQEILHAQQHDAEFVYTTCLSRAQIARSNGDFSLAHRYQARAQEARDALPQFQLGGLWVGKYGSHGYEMINVTYSGDTLIAYKVTGTKNVPKGQVTFQVDLSPTSFIVNENIDNGYRNQHHQQQQQQGDAVLEPIVLGDGAAKQWGSKYLQRFTGLGQVAAEGYHDSRWIEGQLILVNQYFSFAWLPIGHQVFFGRPTPELTLKLLKQNDDTASMSKERVFLEKCWEETQHVQDDMDVENGYLQNDKSTQSSGSGCNMESYYNQEGCFE